MKVEKYHLKTSCKFKRYEFISEGPNGTIRKLIEFQETNIPNVYNLAFGDLHSGTDEIDDLAISNNGDTEKILATVVAAVYSFMNEYPEYYVYATGSTMARTRLYRMGVTKFYEQMKEDFYLYGQVGDDFINFEIGKDYEGFLAIRKQKIID